ncbi:hypothetical protein LTS08_008464 [Lithohypha guttulata]|nr:hypothetical protein LTS08_008464 [Lithohypha guttulata]
MACDKGLRLTDPFFAHAGTIAATLHLFYTCATDQRLKLKSDTDLAKCVAFVQGFTPFSQICKILHEKLNEMSQIVFNSRLRSVSCSTPGSSKIHLSTQLMWDVLQLSCSSKSQGSNGHGIFHSSLRPICVSKDQESSVQEMIFSTPSSVSVNNSDSEQAPPITTGSTVAITAGADTPLLSSDNVVTVPDDELGADTLSLWTDQAHDLDFEQLNHAAQNIDFSDFASSSWWNCGNL